MTYKYTYSGEQDIYLPTLGINAKGNDKEAVYETTEPINHPDFVLASEQPAEEPHQETPEQPQVSAVEEVPQVEPQQETQVEEAPTENVSQEGDAQVE